MNDWKKKIESITGEPDDSWKEIALFFRDNKWLPYSSAIASRVLAAIEDDEEMNQTRLAEALNVSRQQINKIVKGHENLTLETIYKLSQALGVELITFPPYKYSKPIGKKVPKKKKAPASKKKKLTK